MILYFREIKSANLVLSANLVEIRALPQTWSLNRKSIFYHVVTCDDA